MQYNLSSYKRFCNQYTEDNIAEIADAKTAESFNAKYDGAEENRKEDVSLFATTFDAKAQKQLKASLLPESADNKNITFESSNSFRYGCCKRNFTEYSAY